LWAALNERIFEYLGSVSLRHLVDNQKAKESGIAPIHDMREAGSKRVPVPAC
jgi:Rrf2 family iron-sulfur cluster assembly transcriptional regulator